MSCSGQTVQFLAHGYSLNNQAVKIRQTGKMNVCQCFIETPFYDIFGVIYLCFMEKEDNSLSGQFSRKGENSIHQFGVVNATCTY